MLGISLGYVGVPSPGVSIRLAEFKPSPLGTKAEYKVLFETNDTDCHIGNKKSVKVMDALCGINLLCFSR